MGQTLPIYFKGLHRKFLEKIYKKPCKIFRKFKPFSGDAASRTCRLSILNFFLEQDMTIKTLSFLSFISQSPQPSGKMHALAPPFNPPLQFYVMLNMGGSVSGLMPKSLQKGVCWSEAPLCCTKGLYMAKPCSPVLIASSTLKHKERFQWSPVHICMLTALGKHGISSYQPLNFYHSTHSPVVKCMLWLPHLTHH